MPVTLAATQMACGPDPRQNLDQAEHLIRQAAAFGAQIILLQELFETPYFCATINTDWLMRAHDRQSSPLLRRFQALAAELEVVLPVSFHEAAGNSRFNSVVVFDADGRDLGLYRKSHIPEGPGYREKYYFSPGDTGFRTFDTRFARIGVAICWDQWFPEAARAMVLAGAEVLLYPTAIGSEPSDPDYDSSDHWQRVMQGHAAANCVPVVASNRIGTEPHEGFDMQFYGRSFICDQTGQKLAEAGRTEAEVLTATIDPAANARFRAAWGLFRDRRPDLYGALTRLAP